MTAIYLLLLISVPTFAALNPATIDGWNQYVRTIEPRIEKQNANESGFLWAERDAKRWDRLFKGEIVVEQTVAPDIKDGLIQHWTGAVFIPNVTLQQVISVDQDYPRHKVLYAPEVVDSRIIERHGDHFRVYFRIRKQKVITAVLDTEHDVEFRKLSGNRMYSRSISTSVREVKDPGEKDETVLPVGEGVGFLWALNSYWRLAERNGGVVAECEAVSLARSLPLGTGTMLGPIIRSLGEESLTKTLDAKRRALQSSR